MMEFDVEGLCGTSSYVKSSERTNSRNGYRDRRWQIRADDVDLKIPKLRQESYFPGFSRTSGSWWRCMEPKLAGT